MKRLFTAVLASVSVFSLLYTVPVKAEANMVPDYEMKFLIDSDKVLNSDQQLKSEYRDFFNTGKTYETVGVLYIETPEYDFSDQGWNNRIRIKEDSDNFELTYKKRYSIENGDIDSALSLANSEGFDISDTNYEAQVEWGYAKMTLSLSNKKKEPNKGYDELELPKKDDAIEILKDRMPGKLENWQGKNWGKDTLENGKKCGPVYYSKYAGKISGIDIDIEIWPVYSKTEDSTEYITEVSFKEDTYREALENRQIVMDALESNTIMLHEDSLKTQKILDAYLKS